MKKLLLALILTLSTIYDAYSNIEMYLLRKGSKVNIALIYKGSDAPHFIEIERKSTAPLSVYRKIITLSDEHLEILKKEGKLLLADSYPESRQLDSYYRLKMKSKDGIIKTPPGIFLSRASHNESITFGEHDLKDESMFVSDEEKNTPTFEQYGVSFKVERVKLTVLITIGGGNSLDGKWYIERKTSKPLASFRRVKAISNEDKTLVKAGNHVFIDKYPESRKLDSYYRLIVVTKEGEIIELPPVFLEGDSSGSN